MKNLLILLILLGAAWPVPVRAATSALLDDKEKVAESDIIAVGVVKSSEAHWTTDRRSIVTDITVEVREFLKNSTKQAGRTLTISLLRGTIGDVRIVSEGLPEFPIIGEEVLLFLRDEEGGLVIVGGEAGKHSLRTPIQSHTSISKLATVEKIRRLVQEVHSQ